MATLADWAGENWFSLLQSIGIICGLFFTAVSIRRDTSARRASDLLSLSERHQELWSELYRRPEIGRIRNKEVDLISNPVTSMEVEFLRMVFVHFYTGWLLSGRGSLLGRDALSADMRDFFTLPIPKAVWKDEKEGRDPSFIKFVDACIQKGKAPAPERNRQAL